MKSLEIKEIISNVSIKYHQYLQPNNIVVFNNIQSTNSYLLESARTENNKIIFCLAEQQTAGRGRRDHIWVSPAGNIYLSILWSFNCDINQLSGLSIAIGVAVASALATYGINDIHLKWPNDILCQGRKLGGILIETIPQFNHTSVVIGLGINIDISEHQNQFDAIDIISINQKTPNRNLLIGLLINSILDAIFLFQSKKLIPFIQKWNIKDYSYNKSVNIISKQKTISGINRGINQQGNLLLEVPLEDGSNKLHTIVSGEVSLRIRTTNY